MSAGENSVISENNNNVEAEEVIDIEDVPDIVLHPPSSVLWFVTSPVWKFFNFVGTKDDLTAIKSYWQLTLFGILPSFYYFGPI